MADVYNDSGEQANSLRAIQELAEETIPDLDGADGRC
jgi:hypothetical protein